MRSASIVFAVLTAGCAASFRGDPTLLADRVRPPATAPAAAPDLGALSPLHPADVAAPTIVERHLTNGIRVLLIPRHDFPIVDFSFVVLRGAQDAPPGFAHLWIEAATEATPSLRPSEMLQWLRKHSVVVRREAAYAYCAFGVKVLTPFLDDTLHVTAQALLAPSIDEDSFEEATRDHGNAVLRARGSPQGVAYDTLLASLYPPDHVYAKSVVGAAIHPARAELDAFSKRTINASDLAFVAVGDFDVEPLMKRLESEIGKLPRRESARATIPAVAPRKRRGVVVARTRDSEVQFALGFLAPPADDPDRAALAIAAMALREATLHDLRIIEGASYGASLFEGIRSGPAPFVLQSAVEPSRAARSIDDVWHAVDHLRDGLTEDEVTRLRERAIALFPASFDTVASAVANLENIAALGMPATAPAAALDALRKVTAADVKRVAEKYMTEDSLQLVVVGEPAATAAVDDRLEYHAPAKQAAAPEAHAE